MPREQINTVDLTATPVGAATIQHEAGLHVSWHGGDDGHDGHVQVALEADVSYLTFAAETPNGETSDRTLLYTPVLSRAEINKLIRTLKRARDKAYGADE